MRHVKHTHTDDSSHGPKPAENAEMRRHVAKWNESRHTHVHGQTSSHGSKPVDNAEMMRHVAQ